MIRAYIGNLPLSLLINRDLCYLDTFINTPNNVSIIGITVLNFNKFIVLQYLNKRKQQFVQTESGDIQVRWPMKLFKLLNEPYFYLFYFILIYLIICFLNLLVLLGTGFKCTLTQTLFTFFVAVICVLIVIIYAISLVLAEIYINFDKIMKCKFKTILRMDPFHFRFEFYILALFCAAPCYIGYVILSFITNIDHILELIIFSLAWFFLYVLLIGFPILTTIYKLIMSRFKNNVERSELEQLLIDSEGQELLYNACVIEYSIENLLCWRDIMSYRKDTSLEGKKNNFKKIFNLYLNGSNSELEVNISGPLLQKILDCSKQETFDDETLKELESSMIQNLKDTFSRLSTSKEFKIFKKHKEIMKDSNLAE